MQHKHGIAESDKDGLGSYMMHASRELKRVREDLTDCRHLTELQQLRVKATALKEEDNYFTDGMTLLYTKMAEHITLHGADNINAHWATKDGACSLQWAREKWAKKERAGAVKTDAVTAVIEPIEWPEKTLVAIPFTEVKQELESLNLPKLDGDTTDEELIIWILAAAQAIVAIDGRRKTEALGVKIWRSLPQHLRGSVPRHMQHHISEEARNAQCPILTLNDLVKSTDQAAIDRTVDAMKIKVKEMVTYDIRILIRYIKEIYLVEQLRDYKDVFQWMASTLSIDALKKRLMEIPTMQESRKILIAAGTDTTDKQMCERMLGFATPERANTGRDGTTLHIRTMAVEDNGNGRDGDQRSKNGAGLVQGTRRPFIKRRRENDHGNNNNNNNNNHQRAKTFDNRNHNQSNKRDDRRGNNTHNDRRAVNQAPAQSIYKPKPEFGGREWRDQKFHKWSEKMSQTCVGEKCARAPTHIRKDCPAFLSQPCTWAKCLWSAQTHTKAQCDVERKRLERTGTPISTFTKAKADNRNHPYHPYQISPN